MKPLLAKLLVSLSLIFWILNFINLSEVLSLLASFSNFSLLGVLFLTLLAWGLAIYRWFVLLSKFSFWRLAEQTFIANFYSLMLPGQITSEIVKAYRLGKGRSDAEYIAASVVIDKLVALLGLLAVAVIGLVVSHTYVPKGITISIVLFFLFFLIILFCLRIPIIFRSIESSLKWAASRSSGLNHIFFQIFRLITAWRNFLDQPSRLICGFLLGVIFQLIGIWIIILLSHELGVYLLFADWCWIFGVVTIAVLLPISIGGVGVREGVFVETLSLQGVPIEKSVALSLAVFGVSLIGMFIGGLLELFRSLTSSSTSSRA